MWRKVRAQKRSKSAKPFGEKVLEKRRQKARSNAGGNHGYLFGKPWLKCDTQGSNFKKKKIIEMRVSGCVALLKINSPDRRHFQVRLALW